MKKYSDVAVEIEKGIYWVGFEDRETGFSNNPYLLVDEDEAILFDPGPGHPFFRDMIMNKIKSVIDPSKIKYIVVHHQDPDLCGLLPYVENLFSSELIILAHPRTAIFLPYYGIRRNVISIGDGDILELKSGREIVFYYTPYLHFAGAIVSYDVKTKSLFSSDIFAVFDRNFRLYADRSYIELSNKFLENYISSKDALMYAYNLLKSIEIDRILPQHGGIILKAYVNDFIESLKDVEPGMAIKTLSNRPTKEQLNVILEKAKKWLSFWLSKPVNAETLQELLQIAKQEGATTLSLLADEITVTSRKMNVINPLTYGNKLTEDSIKNVHSACMLSGIRKLALKFQFGMTDRLNNAISKDIVNNEFISFETELIIVFIDIRKFTDWSNNRVASEILSMLNKEIEIIAKVINRYDGRINKILGDGVLAYFQRNEINKCLNAFLVINNVIKQQNLLPVGIGVSFGKVILGDIGNDIRLDYTLIGKTVNFASRMCDLADKNELVLDYDSFQLIDDKKILELEEYFKIEEITNVKVKVYDPTLKAVKFKYKSENHIRKYICDECENLS